MSDNARIETMDVESPLSEYIAQCLHALKLSDEDCNRRENAIKAREEDCAQREHQIKQMENVCEELVQSLSHTVLMDAQATTVLKESVEAVQARRNRYEKKLTQQQKSKSPQKQRQEQTPMNYEKLLYSAQPITDDALCMRLVSSLRCDKLAALELTQRLRRRLVLVDGQYILGVCDQTTLIAAIVLHSSMLTHLQ